jgi:hypothetical protein
MKSFVHLKQFAVLAAIALTITMLASCGSSSTTNPNSVSGNWTVTFYNASNSSNNVSYVMTTTLNQQNPSPSTSSPVTGTNLTVTTNNESGCFAVDSSTTQSGILTVDDNFNGQTINTLQLTIQSSSGTIIMRGPFTTSGISGPWALTLQSPNPGCSTSGTFLMTKP